jgi:hypothetical protein
MAASDSAAGSPIPSSRPPQSRRRRFVFAVCMVLVMYAAMELLLFAAISIKFGRMFTFSGFEAQRREVNAGDDPFGMGDVPARLRIHKEVVHPYMGYVYDPSVEQSSPYGISDATPIRHRSDGKVIVGIFGGSFADDISYNMADELAEKLKPSFPGREFVVVKATIGGYKQPQQLMALNWEFDIVINLDGFNDVALPALENVPNTNPFFPRQWHLRMRTVPDTEFLATVGKIKFIDSVGAQWQSFFRTGPLRYSITANTLWRIGDQLLYNAAVTQRAKLPKMSAANGYAAAGPPVTFANEGEMYSALGHLWEESSFQMNAIANAKGIHYFHFLQPNQYVEGSKPMDADERRVAIKEDHPYRSSVRKGYPVLSELGKDLVRRGVTFVDLTNVFANTRDVLYRDNCCHVNTVGQRIVVDAMVKTIRSQVESGRGRP